MLQFEQGVVISKKKGLRIKTENRTDFLAVLQVSICCFDLSLNSNVFKRNLTFSGVFKLLKGCAVSSSFLLT